MEISYAEVHKNYIQNILINDIIQQLPNEKLVDFVIENSGGLDGFMSALYNIKLKTQTEDGTQKDRVLLAKFMKGDHNFRLSSKSYVQFANEIYFYAKILPTYEQLLQKAKITTINVNNWVPKCYKAEFGYIEGLNKSSEIKESVLVLENLKPKNYVLPPNIEIEDEYFYSIIKPLAELHALSYALRLIDDPKLESLRKGIAELYFYKENDVDDEKNNLFRVLHGVSFERFFDFVDRKLSNEKENYIERLRILREKHMAQPARLLELLRLSIDNEKDRVYGLIQHGDFNRNNLLLQFENNKVKDVKMIDFQELRYGSPALDLSFIMYMNVPENTRDKCWMNIIKAYHTHLLASLTLILKSYNDNVKQLPNMEEYLNNFSYDKFYQHFSRFALYGVLICMHYTPWLWCSKEETAIFSHLFETDMHSEEFHKLSIEAGGDEVNYRILKAVKHACEQGYLNYL